MTDVEGASRIYIDANVFIYAVSGPSELALPLQNLFAVFRSRPDIAVTSELTLAEILPRATKTQRQYYLDLLIWNRILDLQPITRDILIETARYRTESNPVKLPDAVHIVTAIQSHCDRILSNDNRLRLPNGFAAVRPNVDSVQRLIQELS